MTTCNYPGCTNPVRAYEGNGRQPIYCPTCKPLAAADANRERQRRHARGERKPATRATFRVVGYYCPDRATFTDPTDFTIYIGREFDRDAMQAEIEAGNIPPGAMVQPYGGRVGVVVRDWQNPQGYDIKPIHEVTG